MKINTHLTTLVEELIMAETEHAAVADTETFSKEYVERLKADPAAKSERLLWGLQVRSRAEDR